MTSASLTDRIVILGAGQAGGRAAEALRGAGHTGKIILVGDEVYPPYERPPLSKELLDGAIPIEKTFLRPAADFATLDIDLRLGVAARAIDRAERRVRLADDTVLSYDRLMLTTGARARRLGLPAENSPHVHFVRSIDDTLALRPRLRAGARLVVVGAGFIGLVVAAIARQHPCAVTVLEAGRAPLGRVVAPEIGEFFAGLHRGRGVDLSTGTTVANLEQEGDGLVVVTGSGERIGADAVVVGIGAVPNAEIAHDAGIATRDGIVTDEFGRTDDPLVYAAGDVTRHYNPLLGRHVRLEAWQNAQNQAIAVAKVMAGGEAAYAELPWFWTDQYDVNFQSCGLPIAWDSLVWRGAPTDRQFAVFYFEGDLPVGANAINNARDMRFIRQLVARGAPVDKARLADPATKLADLLK